ncbi:hypothetical protein ABZX93_26520 [Streptomyces sp. NPDC006632]|uniref:hypothetical protein n=1 Tax=unclassified Streptomyces TaxID=2593676 RepID=UPI002E1CB948
MSEQETWTTEEFGPSHTGSVGVLLADGTVPPPVHLPTNSGAGGPSVSQWSVYDGAGFGHGPRAVALRAVCSCGWNGPEHPLDWNEIADQDFYEAGAGSADTCMRDWDTHTVDVDRSATPLPEAVDDLLTQLQDRVEKLTKTSPLAALRAARRMEVAAAEAGYWAAHGARSDATVAQAATALGLSEHETKKVMARFGRWSLYH